MVTDAIKDISRRGGIVLDPFAGSGSTLIASQKAGRRARLCEIDPVYCNRILQRWEIFAKDDAELVACGLSGRPPADALPSADELPATAERRHSISSGDTPSRKAKASPRDGSSGSRRLCRGRHFGG
jgi:hypothetical protein